MGSSKFKKANALLDVIEETVLPSSGFSRNELLPIAATEVDIDVFALAKPNSKSPGVVVWFAGTAIDRFPNFDEYFLTMVDYNRNEIALLKRDH